MKEKIIFILKILSIPLSLGVISLAVWGLWVLVGLPDRENFVGIVKEYFAHYGVWIVLVSSLFEGVLLLGNFYPGGVVIFLGVATAASRGRAVEVVIAVSIGFFIAYAINYFLGKYGWYKLFLKFGLRDPIEKAKVKLSRHEFSAIVLSYWDPNLSSITATAAGVLRIPLKRFLLHSAFGILVWNTFWGVLVYSLGENALNLISFKWAFIVLSSWIAIILLKYYFYDQRKNPPERI